MAPITHFSFCVIFSTKRISTKLIIMELHTFMPVVRMWNLMEDEYKKKKENSCNLETEIFLMMKHSQRYCWQVFAEITSYDFLLKLVLTADQIKETPTRFWNKNQTEADQTIKAKLCCKTKKLYKQISKS